jgi:plasmid segregation protein ParM
MSILGVDIGYGFTKSYYSKNSSDASHYFHTFPTAVSRFVPRTTFSDKSIVINVNGDNFSLAENALREGTGLIKTRRKDFVGSKAYFAILALSLIRTLRNPAALILGLPPGQFSKEYTESLIQKLRSVDIFATLEGAGNDRLVFPESVKFIPQGAGIFFSYIRDDYYKNVAVLDVGYYTLDLLFLTKGKYVEKSARSYPLGVCDIYEQAKKLFYQEHRTFLKSDKSVDALLTGNKIEIAGRSYELDINEIIKPYTSQVISVIESYIEELPDDPDIFIAGGGGVKFFENANLKYDMRLVAQPQLANAKGFFEYGRCM